MRTFATYEEENIHYWTHRASGYSAVNQEELATDQKAVWRGVIAGKIAGNHPGGIPRGKPERVPCGISQRVPRGKPERVSRADPCGGIHHFL